MKNLSEKVKAALKTEDAMEILKTCARVNKLVEVCDSLDQIKTRIAGEKIFSRLLGRYTEVVSYYVGNSRKKYQKLAEAADFTGRRTLFWFPLIDVALKVEGPYAAENMAVSILHNSHRDIPLTEATCDKEFGLANAAGAQPTWKSDNLVWSGKGIAASALVNIVIHTHIAKKREVALSRLLNLVDDIKTSPELGAGIERAVSHAERVFITTDEVVLRASARRKFHELLVEGALSNAAKRMKKAREFISERKRLRQNLQILEKLGAGLV